MLDKFKVFKPKEITTVKGNISEFLIRCYIPCLMLVVYYLVPTGKEIMEKYISYEFWYVILAIMFFSSTIEPLLKAINIYRSKKNVR